jgi:hypothetical protein
MPYYPTMTLKKTTQMRKEEAQGDKSSLARIGNWSRPPLSIGLGREAQ